MTLPLKKTDKIQKGVEIILFQLGNLKKNEKVCIIVDQHTSEIGSIFQKLCDDNEIPSKTFLVSNLQMHGIEPPEEVAQTMIDSDLVLGLTSFSMAHTKARKNASFNKTRYLSLPNYSVDVLSHESLTANFEKLSKNALFVSNKFSKGKKISISTEKGTSITFDISGRKGNFAPGFVNDTILLGSPPHIEANIAPIENNSNGILVVDGSIPIPQIGKLDESVILEIKNGSIISIDGTSKQTKILQTMFEKYGPKSRVLAELGIGFNNLSKICGNMLIDEGTFGTFHCGFGSNSTIGGLNEINFHLDFVFKCDELKIDNQTIKL